MAETAFFKLSEDVLLSIFFKLEEDPRNWARLACVCTKFLSIVRAICYKSKCTATIPSVVADLTAPDSDSPPGGWAPLFKLAVCCPGIHHAGVLLDNSDFGLERELGPEDSFPTSAAASGASSSSHVGEKTLENSNAVTAAAGSECYWSLYDDLYFDTIYDASETVDSGAAAEETVEMAVDEGSSSPAKKRKICRSKRSHLASGVWNLSREQGNKLLASRFRGDCLYLCDWPGCVHIEEKRNYMLFRGVFKNFKKSRVWRTINDGNRGKMDLGCAFCSCNQTWDLHSAFCLRRGFGYHEDGDPVVRAYVCENGHVSGAWTDLPLYI